QMRQEEAILPCFMAVLLIDKSVRELKAISDTATVLARGRTVWAGSIDDLSSGIAERHIGV
ncbi:MAG: hypothetical protein OXC91_12455, partial [Rhodobacteraceae bacterium]|nr:hypothetical protein [Paracoccaceae bacterium]